MEGDGFFDELADIHLAPFGFSLDVFVELGVASERHHRIGLHSAANALALSTKCCHIIAL